MADLFDEVLNEEKYTNRAMTFRRFFPVIILLTILGALAIGFYSWYKDKNTTNNQMLGDLLVDIINREESNLNEHLLFKDNSGKRELLEIFNVSNSENYSDSQKHIESIISNNKNLDLTIAYAKILWVSNFLQNGDINGPEYEQSIRYLDSFSSEQQVFYINAHLLKALLYIKAKDFNAAQEAAEKVIQNPKAPKVVQDQARSVISHIEQYKDK
ncbi:MAG: hypothetical protein H6909_04210 [Rickettsiaceae bacterium]|nr:hypothetical protein [Rickettsiaceae bacterium]